MLDVSTGSTGVPTGSQTGITVNPGMPTALTARGFPIPVAPNTAGVLQVEARDSYGNAASGYIGTTHLSSTDAQAVIPGDYSFTASDAGQHAFSVTLKTSGSQSISAADTVVSAPSATQSGIQVDATAAVSLGLAGFPNPIVQTVAGSSNVTARDSLGGVAANYRGLVHFSSDDPLVTVPADYAFGASDAGQHTFSATFKTAGTHALTVTDLGAPSLTASQTGIVVNGKPDHLALSPSTGQSPVGGTLAITAQLIDAAGSNLAQTQNITATLDGSGTFCSNASGSFSGDLSSGGSTTLSVCDTTVENVSLSILFSGQTSPSTVGNYSFVPGPSDHLRAVLLGVSPISVCEKPVVKLNLVDRRGNLLTGSATVTVCADVLSGATVDSTTLTTPNLRGRCATGKLLPNGSVTVTFSSTQAAKATVSATSPGLPGVSENATIEWKAGQAEPAHTLFTLDEGDNIHLAVSTGTATARITPRDGCNAPVTLGATEAVSLSADAPLQAIALDPVHLCQYIAQVSLPLCPAVMSPLRVHASLDGQPITDSSGNPLVRALLAQCTAPDVNQTTVSVVGSPNAAACWAFSHAQPAQVPAALGTTRINITVKPYDSFGVPLGTGQTVAVRPDLPRIEFDPATDNGDGSYSLQVGSDACGDSRPVIVTVDGVAVGSPLISHFSCPPVDPSKSTLSTSLAGGSVTQDPMMPFSVIVHNQCDLPADQRTAVFALSPSDLAMVTNPSPPATTDRLGVFQLTLMPLRVGAGTAQLTVDSVDLGWLPVQWVSKASPPPEHEKLARVERW